MAPINMGNWTITATGPLSGANGALPWIVFHRDRKLFEADCPQWIIKTIDPIMPISYLLSGGISMRSLLPGWIYLPIRTIEKGLGQKYWAMFAFIVLEREA